jgi:hypothetical protein
MLSAVGVISITAWTRQSNTGYLAEALSWHAKCTVELARHVLKRDQSRQFHDAVIVEKAPQALDLLIFHLQVRSRHGLCVVEDRLLAAIKQIALAPSLESFHFSRRTPHLMSVAEFRSTQKEQVLTCDTRTVTRERKAASMGEERRSIMPKSIATAVNSFGALAQSRAACRTSPYLRRWFQKNGRR